MLFMLIIFSACSHVLGSTCVLQTIFTSNCSAFHAHLAHLFCAHSDLLRKSMLIWALDGKKIIFLCISGTYICHCIFFVCILYVSADLCPQWSFWLRKSDCPWEDTRGITVLFCRLGLHCSPYSKFRWKSTEIYRHALVWKKILFCYILLCYNFLPVSAVFKWSNFVFCWHMVMKFLISE